MKVLKDNIVAVLAVLSIIGMTTAALAWADSRYATQELVEAKSLDTLLRDLRLAVAIGDRPSIKQICWEIQQKGKGVPSDCK